MGWVRRFYRFVEGQFPQSLGSVHVKDFMTHLAVDRKVSASTQNQAFNAILFLFQLGFRYLKIDVNVFVKTFAGGNGLYGGLA